MNFTSRTYRVAISRSIAREQELFEVYTESLMNFSHALLVNRKAWIRQIRHTRLLQARKRRERK